jgi:transketolase
VPASSEVQASGYVTNGDKMVLADLSHDELAVRVIRGFSMDAPHAAKSGHQGTALALAPLAHVLYSRVLRHDPQRPDWVDRDRFVLSNGHASILQYSALFLQGYGLELEDLRAFRQFGSATPGHPEFGHTTGVEVTTGPLGQGLSNAVGMAIAERYQRATFGSDAINHHTYVIAGDGCLMEGVSHEAASLAGHLGLGRLIVVFDDNRITIDGELDLSCSDDVAGRFRAYGWDVREVGAIAEDLDALEEVLLDARKDESRPTLIVLRSHIGYPSPDHTDDHAAHGLAFDDASIARTKEVLGIPDEPFWAPDQVVQDARSRARERGAALTEAWDERNQELLDDPTWAACWSTLPVEGWDEELPTYDAGTKTATRQAINAALNASVGRLPGLIAGSADLTGNTGVKLSDTVAQTAIEPAGRQIHFGIREHAMGAALVGMARHGGMLPVGGTFFVFLDYLRPSLRMAAISGAKAVFFFTHDSVGVGEDGPTHQPIEHLATLRAVPDLQVIRPADANETVAAWRIAVEHDGPTALVLSRQAIRVVTDGSAVANGAGIVHEPDRAPDVILVATGSEVALCVDASTELAQAGVAARVVSLPSWDRFAAQPDSYRQQVLPSDVPTLSVEAASTFGWERYADRSVGIDRFGASAPGDVVFEELGISVANVVREAQALLDAS